MVIMDVSTKRGRKAGRTDRKGCGANEGRAYVARVEVVPLVPSAAPVVIRSPVVGLVIRVLCLLVVEASSLLVVTRLGVQGRGLRENNCTSEKCADEQSAALILAAYSAGFSVQRGMRPRPLCSTAYASQAGA